MENARRESLRRASRDYDDRGDDASIGVVRKSILKKEPVIDVRDDLDRAMATSRSETPDQWFQRILALRKLSPLDLCDAFCYDDARQHRTVSLKHVCEVLFELEEPGGDPMSDAMEEFLYQFSFDGGDGEIVVDVKEALRTLDIWKTPTPSHQSASQQSSVGAPMSSVSPAKAAILEIKAEKLKRVIDSLQQENLRLSRALSSATANESASGTQPPSPLRIAVKKPTQQSAATIVSPMQRLSSTSKPQNQQPPPPTVVSGHERELIALANQLEYTGVKQLETLLQTGDKSSTGFVTLKQLRWLLANECSVGNDLSESKLMELCLGMNFNAQAQLDYDEFVRVLLDILVYEGRPPRPGNASTARSGLSQADEALRTKTRQYLEAFHGGRDKVRELLEQLCDKYDLEGNKSLSLTEMTRVWQIDVVAQHPVQLKFPLTQSETRRLLLSLFETSPASRLENSMEKDSGTFVYYPAVLDALFQAETAGASNPDESSSSQALFSRVIQPEFWTALRLALCPHDDARRTRQIHTQLCKILAKLDPKHRFVISPRHFVRVFDQHWSARDLEMLSQALSSPLGAAAAKDGVRYDVLIKLIFGAPELRDASALASVVKKLQPTKPNWQSEIQLLLATPKQRSSLSYRQAYELLCSRDDAQTLSVTEFLYLVAYTQDDKHQRDGRVDVHKLWTTLTTEDPASTTSKPTGTSQFQQLRRWLRVLANDDALEKALARLCRHERGILRVNELIDELTAQLSGLRLAAQEKGVVSEEHVRSFVSSLDHNNAFISPGAGLLHVHALMDAIVDWDAMAMALRLPDRLLDVNKTLELFDWDKDGSIGADDLAKAWRQLTVAGSANNPNSTSKTNKQRVGTVAPLHEWELRVLVRRFPSSLSDKRARQSNAGVGAVDYSRLLVSLLERQQRSACEQLQEAVVTLLQQTCDRVTRGKKHVTTFHLEMAFEQIDREGKGYFHLADLRRFVLEQLDIASDNGAVSVQTLRAYATRGPALESVLAVLAGGKETSNHRHNKPMIVSLMRFQELLNHGSFHKIQPRPSHRKSNQRDVASDSEETTTSADERAGNWELRGRGRSSFESPRQGQITLLRDLELCVFEICRPFVDAHGQISPTLAYAHLNGSDAVASKRRPRSQSPVRSTQPLPSPPLSSSFSASAYASSSRRLSCAAPRSIEASSTAMDPLTASRLKHTLRRLHGVESSTHLIGQYFLRLGSSTKHFLELALFAQWIAPLPQELQTRVKQIAKEMQLKSKSGGGQLDLERFIGAVDRRLSDAYATEEAMRSSHRTGSWLTDRVLGVVRPGVLLTRLHQLNVSMRKPEMAQLLRHFGMEMLPEIDHAVFLRRLYELAQQLPLHGGR